MKPQGFDTKHVDQFTDTNEAHHASRRRLRTFKASPSLAYTFDVLGELFFGGAFGFLESRSDHGRWIESLDTLMPIIVVLALLPKLYRPVFLIFSILSSPTRGALSILNGIAETAKHIVSEKQQKLQGNSSQQQRRDILSKLFDLKSRRGEAEDYTIADIQYESHVSLFAGSDTTAIAMRAIVYQLMTHPNVEEKLLEELHDALKAGRLTVPARYADASRLPYFSSCVKEAMRLHPSVGLPMPRHAPTQGCEIAGHYFPGSKSVSIGINPAVIHYNEAIFGVDADLFKPERWLQDNAAQMERHLISFGAGTRTCIGKNISLSEIYKMLPQLLLKFKLELAYPGRPLVTKDHWFHKQEGLDVKVSIR
ncbi:Cytochrome P450 monooxygenase [Pseudocercospora fuligena]|uniref:Cytochrome P450 monooxygenase n=1 Tax=Pseudocercospora fuligena TaxID=685502 RepID=A0A8H6VIE9_9PEZI|nr:Cytochrome P450 monooxygenase [Pseudocercospora fuligena]